MEEEEEEGKKKTKKKARRPLPYLPGPLIDAAWTPIQTCLLSWRSKAVGNTIASVHAPQGRRQSDPADPQRRRPLLSPPSDKKQGAICAA